MPSPVVCLFRILVALCLVLAVTRAAAEENVDVLPGEPAIGPQVPVLLPPRLDAGFRVHIARPPLAEAVRGALRGAAERLQRGRCSSIFSHFSDAEGRSLQGRLDALGVSGAAYLRTIGFRDGQGVDGCLRSHVLAVTSPGSGVVWMCGTFAPLARQDPGLAELVVLHETLHSLGLGENPPSSPEVTHEVVRRCGR